jgi:hypothetical protein
MYFWGQNAIDIKLSWWRVKLHLKFAGWGVHKEKECIGGGEGGGFLYSYRQVCVGKSRLVVFYWHFCIVRFFSFSYFPVSNYILRIAREENDQMRFIKIQVGQQSNIFVMTLGQTRFIN